MKEYERDPLFTRATGDELEVEGGKRDPLACTTVRCRMIVTGFGSKLASQLRTKIAAMVSQSGSPDNAGGNRRVCSFETSHRQATRCEDKLEGRGRLLVSL